MTREKREEIKCNLLRLIKLRSAGAPAKLAEKFGISERSIKRLINELKREGYNIEFWRAGGIYILEPGYSPDLLLAGCYSK